MMWSAPTLYILLGGIVLSVGTFVFFSTDVEEQLFIGIMFGFIGYSMVKYGHAKLEIN